MCVIFSLLTFSDSLQAQAEDPAGPLPLAEWEKEWFEIKEGEGEFEDLDFSDDSSVAEPGSRKARFNQQAVEGGGGLDPGSPSGSARGSEYVHEHDESCEHGPGCPHRRYREAHNTSRRTPDPIPLDQITGENAERIRSLVSEAEAEAAECRRTAQHVYESTGRRNLCGVSVSKGICWGAVKDALYDSGITRPRLGGGAAIEAHTEGYLSDAGFVNRIGTYNAHNAPIGCILVYSGGNGHNYGHAEIKTRTDRYCSDYCSRGPLDSDHHELVGVYCLP